MFSTHLRSEVCSRMGRRLLAGRMRQVALRSIETALCRADRCCRRSDGYNISVVFLTVNYFKLWNGRQPERTSDTIYHQQRRRVHSDSRGRSVPKITGRKKDRSRLHRGEVPDRKELPDQQGHTPADEQERLQSRPDGQPLHESTIRSLRDCGFGTRRSKDQSSTAKRST